MREPESRASASFCKMAGILRIKLNQIMCSSWQRAWNIANCYHSLWMLLGQHACRDVGGLFISEPCASVPGKCGTPGCFAFDVVSQRQLCELI